MRQNNDKLPAMTAMASISESEVNSILPGYKIIQLGEVWGESNFSEVGKDCWEIGKITLVVNYKNHGVVAIYGLKDDGSVSAGEG